MKEKTKTSKQLRTDMERADKAKIESVEQRDLAISSMNALTREIESLRREASMGEKGINSLKKQKEALQKDLEHSRKHNTNNDDKIRELLKDHDKVINLCNTQKREI